MMALFVLQIAAARGTRSCLGEAVLILLGVVIFEKRKIFLSCRYCPLNGCLLQQGWVVMGSG